MANYVSKKLFSSNVLFCWSVLFAQSKWKSPLKCFPRFDKHIGFLFGVHFGIPTRIGEQDWDSCYLCVSGVKCWECCWAGISQEGGILIIWVTSQNHFAFPAASRSITEPLKSVRSQACVHLFVSCQPETAVLRSRGRSPRGSHSSSTTGPQWLTSKHCEPSPAPQEYAQGAFSASEPQIVCVYTAVIHHQFWWVESCFLSMAVLLWLTNMGCDPSCCLPLFLFVPPASIYSLSSLLSTAQTRLSRVGSF